MTVMVSDDVRALTSNVLSIIPMKNHMTAKTRPSVDKG